MKVGIYCNNYKPEDGGASSLVSTIIEEIENDSDSSIKYVFFYEGKYDGDERKIINGFEYYNVNFGHRLSLNLLSKISRALHVEMTFRLDKIMMDEGVDIVLFTSPFYTGIKAPFIFPVWDLGHRTTNYPEASTWYKKYGRDFLYRKMIFRAKYVLSGNQTGKNEIIKYYGLSEDRIKIVPFPVSKFCFGVSEKPEFEIPDIYFFYPAQFWHHKNHSVIVNAMKVLKDKYQCFPTVFLTGSDQGAMKLIQKKIREYGLENQVIITGFLKDSELKYLYQNATAMIYASMLGPNNLPPIEAVYLGCPVIITNIAGHLEQMRDLAAFFDGRNPEQLAEIMNRFMFDKEYRNSLINKGNKVREYWQNYKYIDSIKPLLEIEM